MYPTSGSTNSMNDGSATSVRPRNSLDGGGAPASTMEVEIQFDPVKAAAAAAAAAAVSAPQTASAAAAVTSDGDLAMKTATAAASTSSATAAAAAAAAVASPVASASGGVTTTAADGSRAELIPEKLKNELKEHVTGLLRKKMAYELIPSSGKVVVFDVNLPVKHAFQGLIEHDIKCAPVWDPKSRSYVGLLTVTDFIDILRHFHATVTATAHDSKTQQQLKSSDLGEQKISDWASIKKNQGTSIPRLLCISPEGTLLEAVRLTVVHRVHRLCIVQRALANTVLCILEHHRIIEFLRDALRADSNANRFMNLTIKQCGLGTYSELIKVTDDHKLIEVLNLMATHKISAVPVVDANGIAIDAYSRSDVRFVALDKTYNRLDMTIKEAIGPHRNERPVPTCSVDDTIDTVLSRLIATGKHRLIIVRPSDNKLLGLVSLSDVLQYVLTDAALDVNTPLIASPPTAAAGTAASNTAAGAGGGLEYTPAFTYAPSPSPSPSPMATPVLNSKTINSSAAAGGGGGTGFLPPLQLGGSQHSHHASLLSGSGQHATSLAPPPASTHHHHHTSSGGGGGGGGASTVLGTASAASGASRTMYEADS